MGDHRLTPDGIQARQATRAERELLTRAQDQMLQVRAPRLLAASRDRLYVAAMDGTGNSLYKDAPENYSVVAQLKEDIEALRHPAIAVGYVEGVGTQDGFWASATDAARATTFQGRVEHAYYRFCGQSAAWLQENPDARIHLAGIGFSRGAEAVAALQRMIHERGIRDPMGAKLHYDSDGVLSSIAWVDRPPLVPPGQTVQVASLIDPVANGVRDEDRRLPPSNAGALQFTSIHEPRDHFTATLHVPLGLSEGGTVANFLIGGAHSDVGGAYRIDGVGRIVRNMNVDYLNMLIGEPLLQKVAEPFDPRMYVVHTSDQHLYGLWPSGSYRRSGERGMHTDIAPGCGLVATDTCMRDPVDHGLAATLDWHHVERSRAPGGSDMKMDAALASIRQMHAHDPSLLERVAANSRLPARAEALAVAQDIGGMFDRLADSAKRGDFPGMAAVVKAYVETPAGQAFKPGYTLMHAWWGARGHLEASADLARSTEATPLLPHQAHHPLQHPHAAPTMSQP